MNIGVPMSLSLLVSSVCMPCSGIAGSYGSSISSFLRKKPPFLCSWNILLKKARKCADIFQWDLGLEMNPNSFLINFYPIPQEHS